ncbi:MAG: molybdopterin-dependent oxidoreductase, partial [Candidatus Binataceae bacterium]
YPGRPINNQYAGNVVDICPVGALTEKDFRFRMRVWYLHRTPSICGGCERGCAIDIHHHRGRIYRYKPRYNPAVNGYWICDEGRHSFPALQQESRLTTPMVQQGDRLVPQSWDAAIGDAAKLVALVRDASGPRAIGAVIGAQSTNEEAFALKRFMRDVVGCADHLGAVTWSPAGASGDDDLLIRANKNPNTRGLQALGINGFALDGLAAAVNSGELKMLIVLRADLVRIVGEADFIRRFGALEYLLVLNTDVNATVQMANLALPIAAYPELDGSFTNFKGRVQRLMQAFPPPGDARSAVEVIAHLAQALGVEEFPSTVEKVFAAIAASEPAFRGLSFGGLGEHGTDLAG